MKSIGKINRREKFTITSADQLNTDNHTVGFDTLLNDLFNIQEFQDFCFLEYRSCTLNYCKVKIDELIRLTSTKQQQMKKYLVDKVLFTLETFNRSLEEDGDHNEDIKNEYNYLKSIFDNAKQSTKNRFPLARTNMRFNRFWAIYQQSKDIIYNREKLRTYIESLELRPIKGSYNEYDFEQYTFSDAAKEVGKLYPDITIRVNQAVINSLIKSRDEYIKFINNPPIVKSLQFNNIEHARTTFENYFRLFGRKSYNFFLFDDEPEFLAIGESKAFSESLKIYIIYKILYGRNNANTEIENSIMDGTIDLSTNPDGTAYYSFNKNTPKFIKSFNQLHFFATGEGVGLGMFFVKLKQYLLDKLPKGQVFYAKFFKMNLFKIDTEFTEFKHVKHDPKYRFEKALSDTERTSSNTVQAVPGKLLYAYMKKTFVGYTDSMSNAVNMHGFSSYNTNVSTVQIIPFNLFDDRKVADVLTDDMFAGSFVLNDKENPKMLGYFLKKLPEHKFTFNTFSDMFCPLTALNIQGGCFNLTKDEIRGIYFSTGIFRRNDIRINSAELPSFYAEVFNLLKMNVKIAIYACSKGTKLSRKMYYFVGEEGYYTYAGDKKREANAKKLKYVNDGFYSVALVRGHVFNVNERGSVPFLNKVNEDYENLEDAPEVHLDMNEEIRETRCAEQGKIDQNKGYLIRHLTQSSKCVDKEHVDKQGNVILNSMVPIKYKNRDHYFVYDLETYNSSNKYSIKLDETRHVDASNAIIEEGKLMHLSNVNPYSNMAMKFNPDNGEILNKLFTFDPTPQSNIKYFFSWLVGNAVDMLNKMSSAEEKSFSDFNFYVFAHNGSGFDNVILMYDLLRNIDLKTLNGNIHSVITPKKCDVNGRPLSFDITIVLHEQYRYKRINISFRDSYRILSTPVKDFGSTFGLDVVKLDYPYAFYQDKFGYRQDKLGEFNVNNKLSKCIHKSEFLALLQTDENMKRDFADWNPYANFKDRFESYKMCQLGMNDKTTLVKWSKIGVNIENIVEVSQLEQYATEIYSYGFLKTCFHIRKRMYSEITTNLDMIKSLEEYNDYMDAGGDVYMFDYKKYCEVYNTYDCYNLVKAMVAFKDKIMQMASINGDIELEIDGQLRKISVSLEKIKEINIFQQRSIAGIAWLIAVKSGCLDNVVALKGQLQEFISCDKRGGKCFVNRKRDKFKSKHYDELMKMVGQEVLEDNLERAIMLTLESSMINNDFSSMYPAAMAMMGIPCGVPKPIYKGSEIRGLLENHRPFWVCTSWESKHIMDVPESCKKTDGKNQWQNGKFINQVIDDVKIRYMTQVTGELTLSDFKYQEGEYPIGLYFDECNYTIAGFMHLMFDERTRVRKANPGLGNSIKLVINSVFGRSILKEKPVKSYLVHKSELQTRLIKNRYKLTDKITQYGDYYEINEFTEPKNHSIYPHFGARCLSVSKVMHGQQIYAQSNLEAKLADLANGKVMPVTYPDICRWTVEVAEKDKNGKPIIEWSGSYSDTDSFHVPTIAMKFIKPYIGKQLGRLHSDFEFKDSNGEEELLPLHTKITPRLAEKFGDLVYDMELSDIEGYYCSPKSYGCRVFGINQEGKFDYRDCVKFKGIYKALTSIEKIKDLHAGNPVRFIDVDGVHFVHHRGTGLAAQQDIMCKEVMPYKLNKSKFYYAEGESIFNGHYKFDEMPLKNNKPGADNRVKYYLYDGERLDYITDDYKKLISPVVKSGFEFRYGEHIKCGIFPIDSPVEKHIRHKYVDKRMPVYSTLRG